MESIQVHLFHIGSTYNGGVQIRIERRGGTFSTSSLPESDRFSGCIDEINVAFVEQDATPRLLLKFSNQLHLSGLSLSNTVSFLEIFGIDLVRSTVHKWLGSFAFAWNQRI